jgi:hypothetical protein
MQTLTLKDNPELKTIIKAAFPDYRKQNCFVHVSTECTLSGTYWDGGSRSTYVAVNLSTKRSAGAPQYDPPQFGGPQRDPKCAIPAGIAIVKSGTFCGKTAIAQIFIHPDNVAKFLTI